MVLGVLDRLVADGRVPLEVQGERGGRRKIEIIVPAAERRDLTEPGTLLPGLGFSFWYPPQPVVVGELTAGKPAALAGLRIGDRVEAVDGVAIDDFSRFIAMIQQRAGQATRLTATRDGSTLEFELVPERYALFACVQVSITLL
jgi:S1-C subfamily serine protease